MDFFNYLWGCLLPPGILYVNLSIINSVKEFIRNALLSFGASIIIPVIGIPLQLKPVLAAWLYPGTVLYKSYIVQFVNTQKQGFDKWDIFGYSVPFAGQFLSAIIIWTIFFLVLITVFSISRRRAPKK